MAAYHRALTAAPAQADGPPLLSLVEFALSSMTILYGGLLGVFVWAVGHPRPSADASGVAGLAAGSAVGLALFLHPIALEKTWIAWPWWIPLSAACALATIALTRRRTRRGDSPLRSPSRADEPPPPG